MYRGDLTGVSNNAWTWLSGSSYSVSATINVSKLLEYANGATSVNIYIYRCYKAQGETYGHDCGTQQVPLTITINNPTPSATTSTTTMSIRPNGYTTDQSGQYFTYTGAGNATIYATATFKRTDSSAPTNAYVKYSTSGPILSSNYSETSGWTTVSNQTFTSGGTKDVSLSNTFSVDWDDSYKHICAYGATADSNYSGTTWSSWKSWNATQSACLYIRGPRSDYATFSGSISSVSKDSKLSCSGNTCEGDGVTTSYSLTPNFSIKRTNNTPESAYTKYSYTESKTYPSSTSTSTTAKKNNETYTASGTAKSVSVSVGSDATQCFSLKYGSSVKYHGTSYNAINNTGTDQKCVSIHNPSYTYPTATASVVISPASTDAGKFACSGDTCYAKETGTFSFTRSITMSRPATNDDPSSASYKYSVNTSNTAPTSASSDVSIEKGKKSGELLPKASRATDVTISYGGSDQYVCGSIYFSKIVKYKDGTLQSTGKTYDKVERCVTIKAPKKATFSGSVSISPDSALTYNSSTKKYDGAGTTSGSSTDFYVTPTYTIKRTNDSPTNATSDYLTATGSTYPTTGTKSNTGNLAKDAKKEVTPSSSTKVTVSAGSDVTQCFSESFDSNVVYYGSSVYSRDFAGRAQGCITIHNPLLTYPTATTTSDTITIAPASSSDFSCSGDVCYAKKAGEFTFNRTIKLKRTDSGTPTSATFYYDVNETGTAPTSVSSSKTVSLASNGESSNLITSKNVTTSYGGADQTVCASIYYTKRVYYKDGVLQSGSRQYDSKARCVTVKSPKKATFSATVSSTKDSNLTCTGDECIGNGLTSKYKISVTYKITRTNDDPTNAASRYAYQASATAPTLSSSSSTTGAKTKDQYWTETVDYYPVVDIGTDDQVTFCYTLSFDKEVVYYGDGYSTIYTQTPDSNKHCVKIKNPSLTYTAAFSATSNGYLNEHTTPLLTRTNSNKDGYINNVTRNATTGKWSYNFASTDAGNTYYATFGHDLSLNTEPLYPFLSLASNWEVQYKINNLSWTTLKEDGQKVAGTETPAFTEKKKVSVNTNTVNLGKYDRSNVGTYYTYCQRLYYWNAVNYKTVKNGDESFSIDRKKGTETYSDPVCVTLKNPKWEEEEYNEDSSREHTMTVTGTPSFAAATGAKQVGTKYQVNQVNTGAYFNHSLTRVDGGFDESSNGQTVNGTKINFYSGNRTMYGNSAFNVKTDWRGKGNINSGTYGNKTPAGFSSLGDVTFSATGLAASAGESWASIDTSHTSGKTWSSNSTRGRTSTTFTGTSMVAGAEKVVCHKTYNSPKKWTVQYVDIKRRSTYSTGINASSQNTSWVYDRTELKSTSPATVTTGSDAEYTSDATCVNLERKYNYNVTSAVPTASTDDVLSVGQTVAPEFSLKVERDPDYTDLTGTDVRNYITDINTSRTDVYVITYGVKATIPDSNFEAVVSGGKMTSGNDFCAYVGTLAGSGNISNACTSTGETDNLGGHKGTGVSASTSYTESFTADTITVPSMNVGDKFCVAIGISNSSSTRSSGFLSKSTCTNIGKRPTLHVWGGSIASVGDVSTSYTKNTAGFYGSWTDLAIIANGKVNAMSSGNGIVANKAQLTYKMPCQFSLLTIANSGCATNAGLKYIGKSNAEVGMTAPERIEAIWDRYQYEYEGKTYRANFGESMTFGGAKPPENRLNTIYRAKNIYIPQNVLFESTSAVGDQVKQIIFMADENIYISADVTEINAWLIAGGTIYTCTDSDKNPIEVGSLAADQCTNKLTVNGPMEANQIIYRRTKGADEHLSGADGIEAEAELVNFLPSYIISGYRESSSELPFTTYQKELAPRY